MSRARLRLRRACKVTLVLGLVAGCTARAAEVHDHEVRYALEWSVAGVRQNAGAPGWEVVNDLGYRVSVTRGYLVSRSMELVECPHGAPQQVAALLGRLGGLLGPGVAYAGHSGMAPNPAALTTPLVEPLGAVRAAEAGRVSLAPESYCRAHYLVARADRSARALPEDLDMLDQSLRLEGTYVPPGGTSPVPFALATSIADGTLVDLFPPGAFADAHAALRFDTGRAGARVVIRRELATLFDGIAFASMSDKDVARRVVRNLIEHTRIEIEVEPQG